MFPFNTMRFYKLCGKLTAYICGCFPSERCDCTNSLKTPLRTSAEVSLQNDAILQTMWKTHCVHLRMFPFRTKRFYKSWETSLRTSADVSLQYDAILQTMWKIHCVHLRMFPFRMMRFYKSRGNFTTYICGCFPSKRCDFTNHEEASLRTSADISLMNDAILKIT